MIIIKGKGKVVPGRFSYLTENHAMMTYWRKWKYSSTHSLTKEQNLFVGLYLNNFRRFKC